MIYELKPHQFREVRRLFEGPRQYIPAQAVVDGHFPGRVFAGSQNSPTVALVWAISRWGYIEGNHKAGEFLQSLPQLIRETIIPGSLETGRNWFELYAPNSADWICVLDDCLAEFNASRHFESVYRWDEQRYGHFRSGYTLPEELAVEKVEAPIVPKSARSAAFVSEHLATKTAPGFRLAVDGRVVAQCRSNGFVSGNAFMIDVDTYDKKDRGKGYATAAGVALLDYCVEHDLTPVWETTEDNIASRRLADRLGFVEDAVYPVYAIEF